ncbi:MAG: nucleotidyltransferase domain-containing protein, partial [Planctomycetota bacterium]
MPSAILDPLFERQILRVVIGSRAYGLDDEHSDEDRRGVFLPLASQHWSLDGVPEVLRDDAIEWMAWELQKFLRLALKGNPTVLE